ncbi:MAG: helix-turn-helix domain-containing protein [Paenacidovorax caeni]
MPPIQQALELTRSASPGDSDAERLRLSDQLLDLGALALGATPRARHASARPAQARLKAIQADLRVHAWREDLSLERWRRAMAYPPATCARCSSRRGTAFSDYLLELRLQRAFDHLTNPRHARSTVSAIAYDAGFNNLSWFYRAFKQRFAAAPGDVRQQHTETAQA